KIPNFMAGLSVAGGLLGGGRFGEDLERMSLRVCEGQHLAVRAHVALADELAACAFDRFADTVEAGGFADDDAAGRALRGLLGRTEGEVGITDAELRPAVLVPELGLRAQDLAVKG